MKKRYFLWQVQFRDDRPADTQTAKPLQFITRGLASNYDDAVHAARKALGAINPLVLEADVAGAGSGEQMQFMAL